MPTTARVAQIRSLGHLQLSDLFNIRCGLWDSKSTMRSAGSAFTRVVQLEQRRSLWIDVRTRDPAPTNGETEPELPG